jgi:hypothetical protein
LPSSVKAASSYPGVDFFGVFAGLEVTNAVQTLAGDVTEKTPESGFVIGYLLAPFIAKLLVFLDAVDSVAVKTGRQTGLS